MYANKMKLKSRTAPFLSDHADDAEFGYGGIIQKMVSAGVRVTSLVFSISEEDDDIAKYSKDIRRKEYESAANIWGLRILES